MPLGESVWVYATVSNQQQTRQQQQQPFNGRLSGTTRVGRYQKKHSLAHTHPGQRTSFITFLHLQRSMVFRNIHLIGSCCQCFWTWLPKQALTSSQTWRQFPRALPTLLSISSCSASRSSAYIIYSAYVLDSPLKQPLSRSSLVFPLVLNPQLHTPCISSPNHHHLLQHMPIPTQPVLLQYQCYVIYT